MSTAGAVTARARWTRRRRVLAVLCSGLVLGVGTTVTLAAWTDNEYSRATFGASVFQLVSKDSTTATYTDHPSGGPITFSTTGMSPSVDAYVGMDVRTTSGSTVGGAVGLVADTAIASLATGSNGLPLSDVLEYRAVRLTGASIGTACSAAFTAGASYLAGDASTYVAVTTQPATTTATVAAGAADMHRYCFDVRIKANADSGYQGAQAAITWHVTGSST